jgi:hypothetical protein
MRSTFPKTTALSTACSEPSFPSADVSSLSFNFSPSIVKPSVSPVCVTAVAALDAAGCIPVMMLTTSNIVSNPLSVLKMV